jgi:hypothetical protein
MDGLHWNELYFLNQILAYVVLLFNHDEHGVNMEASLNGARDYEVGYFGHLTNFGLGLLMPANNSSLDLSMG